MREVVGVALVEGGRVLAARRSRPAALAGLWEFPGGKVEPGEDPETTAVREIAEELGCAIEITGWLDGRSAISDDLVLLVVTARLIGGDPVPYEHDAVRWLRSEDLDQVTWADADLPFLDPVRELLVQEYDGWPESNAPSPPNTPLVLPAAPLRIRRKPQRPDA